MCQSHLRCSSPNRNKHKADHLLNCLVVYEDFITLVAELSVRTVLIDISFFLSTAVYSDQTDTSGYPESEYSFSSQSSMISDFGEAPLSSTRRSSFFNLSNIHGRPSCKGISYNKPSDMDTKRHLWNDSASQWASEGPSILSSTRMSAAGLAVAMPILKEDHLCTYDDVFESDANERAATTDGRVSLSRRDTLPAFPQRRASRKSVSFREVDEYFPVFSLESPKQLPAVDGSQCPSNLPFELSEYSDFLDSDRMATVLHSQGIDVTSPDHVYVFCRESSESTEEEMEKTVISRCALEDSDDELEGELVKDSQVNIQQQAACVGSSSSGTGSSHYSSCDSDHYTSALEMSLHPKHCSLPVVEKVSVGSESDKEIQISTEFDSEFTRRGGHLPPLQTGHQIESKPETVAHDTLALSEIKHLNNDVFEGGSGPDADTYSKGVVDQPMDNAAEALQENFDLPFTPSPFVTGRTRSRLSRCSLRTSRTPESLLCNSSLFEETLPTPVRTRRQTPKSQSSEDFYSSPHAAFYTPSYSGSSTGGHPLSADVQDTQSSTLQAGSSVSSSQADTLILSRSVTDSVDESQTLSDTVILEKKQDSSMYAYERNLAEVIQAMQGHNLAEGRDFLTDDPTSSDEATTKGNVNYVPGKENLKNEDVWLTEDSISQPQSVSSSSSSSGLSLRGSSEDYDLSCTPGTGCTPRYSMSRLSSCRRPQHLANLSYTPGGRPHIQDLEEPVEYLYTDTEQGHKLIEIHVPPTADTSLSSSMSTSSSDETILYDWRTMRTDMMRNRGKENQRSAMVLKKKENDEESLLPETKGLTDKELRLRLAELGESPGPICSRTRPTYMRKLCRLLQESNLQSPLHRRQLDQPQTGNT